MTPCPWCGEKVGHWPDCPRRHDEVHAPPLPRLVRDPVGPPDAYPPGAAPFARIETGRRA